MRLGAGNEAAVTLAAFLILSVRDPRICPDCIKAGDLTASPAELAFCPRVGYPPRFAKTHAGWQGENSGHLCRQQDGFKQRK